VVTAARDIAEILFMDTTPVSGPSTHTTFDDRLQQAKFRPSGFDYMRLLLAIGVVGSHSVDVSYGAAVAAKFWNTPAVGIMEMVLPMFFGLSGFLVAGSLVRCRSLISFLGLRAFRIYPALIVEVVISALLIGPLLTNLPLRQYFADPLFARYLFNVTGNISYELPGVFLGNPLPGIVNSQLWTVPWELVGYAGLGVLMLLGIKRHRIIAPLGVVAVLVFDALMLHAHGEFHRTLLVLHDTQSGGKLLAFFLLGITGFLYRSSIPYSRMLFWVSLLASPVLLYAVPAAHYLTLLPLSYATLYLGLSNPRRLGFIGFADYSYGIYLYGWVFQQLVAALLPWSHQWYLNLALALPLTLLAGMASWHLVERPLHRLKRQLFVAEEAVLSLRARLLLQYGQARPGSAPDADPAGQLEPGRASPLRPI
jgi:peptidoglycan/LPS O-acetylase OafA/YrhL